MNTIRQPDLGRARTFLFVPASRPERILAVAAASSTTVRRISSNTGPSPARR